MSRVTLSDVAKAAAVSTATVSHALKGTGRTTAHTRDRVRALASALGYDGGSAVPRALGLAVTTYGYTDWNFAEVPFFSRSITAATVAAHRHGYALVTLPCAAPQNLWTALRVAGVVLMDSPADDHVAATRGVLDHLAAQGARRVALLAGPGEEHYTRACVAAYTEWCRRRGQLPQVVQNTLSPHPDGPLDRVLASPERPDAVFGIYDYCGRRALTSAARLGLRVPEDLLVVCASEDPSYAFCDPPVSTLSLAPDISIPAAVTALIDVIETSGRAPEPAVVPTRLTLRASSMRDRERRPGTDD
ncbi:LacI family DNA-binding transcriptional regulator [Streptomyces acidiscabies]|nr:LacI family DNA-binding transcriptional regulator [Streptomyces acidiscabies]